MKTFTIQLELDFVDSLIDDIGESVRLGRWPTDIVISCMSSIRDLFYSGVISVYKVVRYRSKVRGHFQDFLLKVRNPDAVDLLIHDYCVLTAEYS